MTPATLDELLAIPDREERIRAADDLIEHAEAQAADARKIRNEDIRALIAEHGPAEAARRTGRSLSTIKLIRGAA